MREIKVRCGGQEFQFATESSLFSPNQLDQGSRILLDSIRPAENIRTLLDLGCGWGAMGIILAKLYPDKFVYLLDNDPKALACTEKNLKLNLIKNAKVLKGDVTYSAFPQKFDLIITNPPWTKNISVIPFLVKFARHHLNENGAFYAVINSTYRLEDQMEKYFGNVSTVSEKLPYKVLRSQNNFALANDLLESIQSTLREYKILPDPLKSQYFLTDSAIIDRVVGLAELKRQDVVLEIGPGLGSLSQKIAEKAEKIIAVEIDPQFRPALNRLPKNVEIIYEDFFKLFRTKKPPFKFNKVISNLPYSSAGPVLFKLANLRFETAVLILPAKIIRRWEKSNFNRRYIIQEQFNLSRSFFYPTPDTDSVVVKLQKS